MLWPLYLPVLKVRYDTTDRFCKTTACFNTIRRLPTAVSGPGSPDLLASHVATRCGSLLKAAAMNIAATSARTPMFSSNCNGQGMDGCGNDALQQHR